MKILAIMLKDLRHAFRSIFGLMFMFGIPLLLTGVFYFAFSGTGDSEEIVKMEPSRVVLVNEDTGDQGVQLVALLSDASLQETITFREMDNENQALKILADGQTDVVITLPDDFSAKGSDSEKQAVRIYAQQANSTHVMVAQSLLASMLDTMQIQQMLRPGLSTGAISAGELASAFETPQITQWIQNMIEGGGAARDVIMQMIANIMGAMMIFFAFFSGAFGAQSILTEEAAGTLQRLFTTGNSRQTILAGKFLAVWISIVVQVAMLLLISGIVFHIEWGNPFGQLLLSIGIGTASAGFGIFLLSFLRSIRSAGMIFSGAIMISGFVGIGAIFTGSGVISPSALFVPQGWALKGLLALQAADVKGWGLAVAVLLAWGLGLFFLGKLRFDKRYQREM